MGQRRPIEIGRRKIRDRRTRAGFEFLRVVVAFLRGR
jgi:hypothetical protein